MQNLKLGATKEQAKQLTDGLFSDDIRYANKGLIYPRSVVPGFRLRQSKKDRVFNSIFYMKGLPLLY